MIQRLLIASLIALIQMNCQLLRHYPTAAPSVSEKMDYRQAMVSFICDISSYARCKQPNFIILPQNGLGLLGDPHQPNQALLQSVDGFAQESYLVGYAGLNRLTPQSEIDGIKPYLNVLADHNKAILLTNYCDRPSLIASINQQLAEQNVLHVNAYLPLNELPTATQAAGIVFNDLPIKTVNDAANYAYVINYEHYPDIRAFVSAVQQTDYDLLICDSYDNDGHLLSVEVVQALKQKRSGNPRLVIAYLSIGEAEDYRPYFKTADASWLDSENPNWPGNFRVKYWQRDWQNIIFGSANSYLDTILALGYDGVFLDTVDTYEYYQRRDEE